VLVIVNGPFKSGSTWLFNIVSCMVDHTPLPAGYQNPRWNNPSIHPRKLADFVARVDYQRTNYVSKNHLCTVRERDFILAQEGVRVLSITRDLRDVVTSAYYHYRRKEGYAASFETFYWQRGRGIANFVRWYNRLWGVPSPRLYVASYERLLADFTGEVRQIGKFLGLALDDGEIERVRGETTLEALREKYGQSEDDEKPTFFRKGVAGDWMSHFDEKMLRDIEKIERSGMSLLDRVVFKLGQLRGAFSGEVTES